MSQVKSKFQFHFLTKVDSQFHLPPSPNSQIIRARRQTTTTVNEIENQPVFNFDL